ncbi:MAG: glycosyltransferase family 2 protein [Actinobacteria bacterium]|nr:glycosyltransferase family 2 protein [Actinomycetota bacterium]
MSLSNSEKIAVIIPALNEEERIESVLDIVTNLSLIDEVIVVDDGSIDNTSEIVKKNPRVKLISHSENKGKGGAIATGINSTNAEILVFIDADLIGLTEEHLRDLIEPVLEDKNLMMTIGKFESGRLRTDLAQKISPFLSGQRVIRREFLNGIGNFESSGFGVEIYFTKHAKDLRLKTKEIRLSNISHVMKEEKLGFKDGVIARLNMYKDIFSVRRKA